MFIARFMNRCERIFSEGQACFRNGSITQEQIAKVKILNKKYKNHHIIGDAPYLYWFKKFDIVWRDALFGVSVMKKHTIAENWLL